MKKYEKSINFRTVLLTFKRRYLLGLSILLFLSIFTVVATQIFIPKTYISYSEYYRLGHFYMDNYYIIPEIVKSVETAEAVSNNLSIQSEEHAAITHANGKPITAEEIYNGIYVHSKINATTDYAEISFQSTDVSIVKYVLDEINNVSIPKINLTLSGTSVSKKPTNPTKNSEDNKYLLLGIGASFVISIGSSLIYEIETDTVYDKCDIEKLGGSGFDLWIKISTHH